MGDRFGSAGLRAGVLDAWRGSPTRLREDAATEADLVRAGYRDRLLTELAQNAADAAARAGVPGKLAAWFEGRTLHVANTGVPLDISGVHALTALRASAKPGADASVGRFGVGFTAVLTVGDEIEFRSRTGTLLFSRERTRDELHRNEIALPQDPEFVPPALRLAWPFDAEPVDGFDSEIVVHLRADVDIAALSATMRAEAADLLLELPALRSLRIDDDEIRSESTELGSGLRQLTVSGPAFGERIWWQFDTARARWLLPVVDGRPVPAGDDVLRAPTRSDEELSLPALLIAQIPMQPDRRRLLPGARVVELASGYADFARALPPRDRLILVPAPGFARSETDSLLREALVTELRTEAWLPVVSIHPAATSLRHPTGLGPANSNSTATADESAPSVAAVDESAALASATDDFIDGTTQSDAGGIPIDRSAEAAAAVDESTAFAAATDDRINRTTQPGAEALSIGSTAESAVALDDSLGDVSDSGVVETQYPGTALATPARASVFSGVSTELADLLADLLGPLVIPELSGRAASDALNVLDVHRIGLARIADLSSSLERPPQWWYSFYDALEPFVVDPLAAEELGALAVPLADGRRVTGPRTVVLGDELELVDVSYGDDLVAEIALPVHWARLVHPEAAHDLLGRLGARQATVEDLLADPALEAALQDDPADPDTVEAVLRLAGQLIDPSALPDWLGTLELPDEDGELLPADELLLPGAPLAGVLAPDSPFGTVDSATLDRYGEQALRAIGVGWGFSVVTELDPTGPDHHLDDEETWWETLVEDPPELIAVRDLDLVDQDAWPNALRLLLSEPRTRRCLADRDGYTAWWLRHHARIGGTALGLFRAPGDEVFAGLLPAPADLDPADLAALHAVLADPDTITPELAAALLDALADPTKTPSPEAISQTHRRLAAALDLLDLDELAVPERVRALSGAVIDPADALILDEPCYGLAVPPDRLVVGDRDTARALSTLLDLPLVSEAVTAEVLGTGRVGTWQDEPLGVVLRLQFGAAPADAPLILHENLRVYLSGAYEATVEVPWWREGEVTHVRAQSIARTS
ncbi:sacsin N-terminal ATP-binding-like domain-containing protein [Nocardia coffeae]|uniref:sacsin N-terminal ATP-binding-like domain-containing protein n=1 Tax=Nocardia coffeae TaxID=2873381 RepID=UPI0027E19DEA|nr:ATP-binding protein [Nocardia coffeae]